MSWSIHLKSSKQAIHNITILLTDATSGELMFLNELEIKKAYTFYLLKLYVLIIEFKSMCLASLYITLLPEYQDKKIDIIKQGRQDKNHT